VDVAKSFVRISLTFALLAVFIVFYVQPAGRVPPLVDFGVVLAIELVAYALQRAVAEKVPGFVSFLVRLIVVAFLTAFFIAVFLSPRVGFDGTFIVIWGIEVTGFLVADLSFRAKARGKS